MERLGVLSEIAPATTATCDSCGADHVEQVVWFDAPGCPRRAYIPCPLEGRTPVDPARLRRWAVCTTGLAERTAAAVGSTGVVEERVSGRAWKLGTVRVGDRVWIPLLIVGLSNPSAKFLEKLSDLGNPNTLVFVPSIIPPASAWTSGRPARIVSLADVMTLDLRGLVIDPIALASAVTPADTPLPTNTRFHPPEGTTWEQIELIVGDHDLTLRAGGHVSRVGFVDAGFEDGRKKNVPDQMWRILTLLAQRGGVLGTPDSITTKSAAFKRKMSVIRKRLKALVGLNDDPFYPVGRGDDYRVRFRIRAESGTVFPTPNGATWSDISIVEVTLGTITVSADGQSVGVEMTKADPLSPAGFDAAVGPNIRSARYLIADLDAPIPARDMLVDVLRGGGTVRRPGTDAGMLSLGSFLTSFFQLVSPPFTFDHGNWTAEFEAWSAIPDRDR